jgi:hypothetical protein
VQQIFVTAEGYSFVASSSSRHEELAGVTSDQGRRFHPPKWDQSLIRQVAINLVSVEVGSETVLVSYSTVM